MPQNVETEMLLVTSDDYWGHAGDFDPAVNFYPYTFIIKPSEYASMDDADKGRFFPCALFYYAGETDNHGFQPRRIGCRVEDDSSVSMGRVAGVDRLGNQEIRTYRVGTDQGYSIPGYPGMAMLAGTGDSYAAMETAAEAGELSVGAFDISGLLYNQEAVVETINRVAGVETEDSAAESYAAEVATPSGYNDVNPEDYVATPEATPEGYEEMDSAADVEDYFAAEYNFNHTVGDFTQDSAAGSGHGVPEYYGSNSKSPMVMEAEVMYGTDGSVVGQAIGNWDSTPFGYQAEEFNAYSDPISDRQVWKINELGGKVDESMTRSQASDYIKDLMGKPSGTWRAEGPEVMWEQDEFVSVRDGTVADVIADEYLEMGEDYDDADDYARRAAKKMSAEGLGDYTGPLTNGFGENSASVSNYGVPVWYGSAEEAYNGMGENSASISGQGVPQWYGSAEELGPGVGMPAIDDGFYPNSYGEDSSTSGQGVPQWYGSAENHASENVQIQKPETRWAMAVGAAVLGALTAWTLSNKVGESSAPEEPEEEPEE